MKKLAIGGKLVGPNQPVFIIAEAGVNHNGDRSMALELVEAAADAGADAVKFQTFRADLLVAPSAPKADYQQVTTDAAESQHAMLKKLELSEEDHRKLIAHSRSNGIIFLSTPFDNQSADLLNELDVPAFKISSGDLNNLPFLKYVASMGKPMIVSSGMADLGEVEAAVRVILKTGNNDLVLMHCTTNYPTAPSDVNLRSIRTLRTAFRLPVGYSDHTDGITLALAATALGACVIEKHFTLDKGLPGPDHRASIEPDELRKLVKEVRLVEAALGDGIKAPATSELDNRKLVRRSLAAAENIEKGVALDEDMLIAIRPATGIPPSLLDQVIGSKTRRSLTQGELLSWSDLE